MSLSAKQRILKLRETEFKLQKLQNDLLNGNDNSSTNMTEFLSHHRELMALPGSNRDSLPFRFSFEAPNRYMEMKQAQKLTLPPKIPAKSVNRLRPYKEAIEIAEESNKQSGSSFKAGLAGHRSLALQSLLSELDKQTSKMMTAFPKLDKLTLLNKTPFLRGMRNKSSKRYVSPSGRKSSSVPPSTKGHTVKKPSSNTEAKTWSKSSVDNDEGSKKVKLMWNNEISETSSTATASELLLSEYSRPENSEGNSLVSQDSVELKEGVVYALGTSNLMGVILPSNSTHTKRGPNTWGDKTPTSSSTADARSEVDENENITVKEAVTILRRRKFPERKSPLPKNLSPHERGLIGVEISNFEPQCAFFYRDRNGNYNPHLHHSKHVIESMKNGQKRWGWNKRVNPAL